MVTTSNQKNSLLHPRFPDTVNDEVFSSGVVQATVEKEFDHAQLAHLELPGHAASFHGGQQPCKRGIRHVG